MKKFLQFNDIKNLIKSGKDEFMFLKNLVVEDEGEEPTKNISRNQKGDKPKYIEMAKMNKLQKQNSPIVSSFQGHEQDSEEEAIDLGKKGKKPYASSGS